MGWWIAAAVLACVIVWAVMAYNRLVELRNRIANAFAQIDVQLKRRHDLVPNLVEVAKKYLSHEHDTLQAVIAARGQAQSAAAVARREPGNAQAMAGLAAADGLLGGALGRLMVVSEAYPDLKADQTMRELSEELTSTENRIGFARQAFNDAVLDFNTASQVVPTVLVARLAGFTPASALQATQSEAERQPVKVQF
ncbi:hypothetical protein CCO03_04610 [Comamonas serinivorans]|uniref:LemA family protein n=1 Tax=Comamonas serinivorans TaxID=1082851 RepID=A0A1Y0EKT3_9BURK|nr:LemA family protein [Comamonas serinivorans]ARU04051.1 hypothetical protein CCO03_04610 [Comamonas serinivorans]